MPWVPVKDFYNEINWMDKIRPIEFQGTSVWSSWGHGNVLKFTEEWFLAEFGGSFRAQLGFLDDKGRPIKFEVWRQDPCFRPERPPPDDDDRCA